VPSTSHSGSSHHLDCSSSSSSSSSRKQQAAGSRQQQQQQQQQLQHLTSAPILPHSAHATLSAATGPWSPTFHGNSISPGNSCISARTREHSPTRNALHATTNAWDVPPVQRIGQNALMDLVPSASSIGCGGAQQSRTPPFENSLGSMPRRSAGTASPNLVVASAFAASPPTTTAVSNHLGLRESQAAGSGACGEAHQAMSLAHGKTPALRLDAWSSQAVNAAPRSARC